MENPVHSLWKSKNSFPTSCKQGFPQSHEHSKLYDISIMPAPTESIPFIYLIHEIIILQIYPCFFYKIGFSPDKYRLFFFRQALKHTLYPFSIKEVPFAIKYSFISSHSCHNPSNNALLSVNVSSSSKPCGGL